MFGLSLALIFIFGASIAGFCIACFIRGKKRKKTVLVCPIGSDCDAVVHSQYASFLGVPLEIIGIGYFALIFIFYVISVLMPAVMVPVVVLSILSLSGAAFLFSGYLTFIQAFNLKQWCTWCLTSAALSTVIFFAAYALLDGGIVELLALNAGIISSVHLTAFSLGLGSAVIGSVLFLKFLRDFRISEPEYDVLKVVAQVFWASLAFVVLSGAAHYVPVVMAGAGLSPFFSARVLAIALIVLVSGYINLILEPRLVRISFGSTHAHAPGELARARGVAIVLQVILLASWLFAFGATFFTVLQ